MKNTGGERQLTGRVEPEEVLDDLDVAGDLLTLPVPVVLDLDPALLVLAVGLLGRLALAGLDLLHGILGRSRGTRGEGLLLPRYPDVLADEHVAAVLLAVHVVLATAHVDYQEQGCCGVPSGLGLALFSFFPVCLCLFSLCISRFGVAWISEICDLRCREKPMWVGIEGRENQERGDTMRRRRHKVPSRKASSRMSGHFCSSLSFCFMRYWQNSGDR